MKNFNPKTLLKWVPVVIAAAIAGVSQLTEQKEQEKIEDIDKRLSKLENEGEEA